MVDDSARPRLGVLGGSGLYEMQGLENVERIELDTPFGPPSDQIVVGDLEGTRVAFLARHGRGHRLMPSEINYRANVFAMKRLGVDKLVSASAVGSLKEEIAPLDVVVPDQFIDRTRHRTDTFFGGGLVAHVSLAHPVCPDLSAQVAEAAADAGATVHRTGTYLCMEGPQFSTRAESELYRNWGASIIGMTNLTEARLAREAELCFATMALVTDYDCWNEHEEPVSVEAVVERLHVNADRARDAVRRIAERLGGVACGCGEVLSTAIITPPDRIPDEVTEQLRPIVGRALGIE
jgi:5'-methylthioadenosine phosphorylase